MILPILSIALVVGCHTGPTYQHDIAPFVQASCLSCHSDGGASGIPLTTWEEVREVAPAALAAMQSGRMPAGNIDRTGECGTFAGPAPVTAEDIERFARWVDEGTVQGTPEAASPAPPSPAFSADFRFEFGPFDGDIGEHRCMLVEGDADPGYLRALRVEVSDPGAVHHVMLFTLPSPSDVEGARALDAEDDAPGWACEGVTGLPGAMLAAVWTPGSPVVAFPEGTGLALPGAAMVVQLHLGSATARAGAEAHIDLDVAAAVDRPLRFLPIAATGFLLPPGEAAVTWTETHPLAASDFDVVGVFPHMHAQGRELLLRSPDACLVHTPRWDYTWQELAFYTEPVSLSSGTPLELSCTFSTLAATAPTVWGESATDEMCMVFLLG